MENSINHLINIWIHENESHPRGVDAISALVESGKLPAFHLKIISMDTPFSRKKIKQLLKPFIKHDIPLQQSTEKKKKEYGSYSTAGFPDDLKLKETEQKMLYEVLSRLRGDLQKTHYTLSGNKRKSPNLKHARILVFEILEVEERIDQIWTELDYWKEHKSYLPGTTQKEMPNELKLAASLLDEQVNAVNYIRKQDTYKKKHGVLQNPEKYRSCKQTLSDIKEFIDKHGR